MATMEHNEDHYGTGATHGCCNAAICGRTINLPYKIGNEQYCCYACWASGGLDHEALCNTFNIVVYDEIERSDMINCTMYRMDGLGTDKDEHRFDIDHVPSVGDEVCLMFHMRRMVYTRIVRRRFGVNMGDSYPTHRPVMDTVELWYEDVNPDGTE